MDFANAALLLAVVYGLTTQVLSNLPANIAENKTWKTLIVNAIAIGGTFLVSATVWGSEQLIGDDRLSDMGGVDKVVIGLVIAGGASFLHNTLKVVRNVGENDRPQVSYNYFDKSSSAQHPVPPEQQAA